MAQGFGQSDFSKNRKVQDASSLCLSQLKEAEENKEHLRNKIKILKSIAEKIHEVIWIHNEELEALEDELLYTEC